ncbi:phosphocholine-specific phospholipase C [Agriterribacter humi]|uniref:phosphocholine-specific phospholipase C n=1 Tax=Agriterribacter humi TaxID=1104781 RepID=UPI0012644E15|nr:phospholipase C, phosphocholine-specific [Agriterribacter humi]
MDTRRDFIKKAALLSGGTGLLSGLPPSIQKAFAINPEAGSTYLDAEHIVFLMQENRSFDHCYGTLQGVRGFNDPRAIPLPNKNKVWLQSNAAGETYAPFRLNIKESNITWLGSLPHGWSDMTDARNEGKHDKWLDSKKSGHKEVREMPLTMGHFNRQDIPFYYALADAFTVCDQHFCGSLTGTTPNRLYFWTGTIREKHDENVQANVYNSDVTYDREASWKTFPEYLEENDIPWRIYQNELSVDTGFEGEEEDWLANFTDNPIEWFSQFKVRFSPRHIQYMKKMQEVLPAIIKELEEKIAALPESNNDRPQLLKDLNRKKATLARATKDSEEYNLEAYNKLSEWHKNLHEKAFTDNRNDPDYRHLTDITYTENNTERKMEIPKGDVLHQFRTDVENGKLPTVSWIVAPCRFSDHPGSPWYGAWYLSEVIDILTKNPEVWKKTIFVLNYDENDGYFDHVPPFVPPNPYKENSGLVSAGIDTKTEYLNRSQQWMKDKAASKGDREGPIGLGFRVPMVVASPWSRGGFVNSEVFDLTSPIQFLEHFLSKKTGKKIENSNLTQWRRTVSGDLTSVFRPYNGEAIPAPKPVDRIPFLESIHKAQFKALPSGFKNLSTSEIEQINKDPYASPWIPQQEKGTRPATPLPYQLYADGKLSDDKQTFKIKFAAKNEVFGTSATGSPFNVYMPGKDTAPRNYAVKAGDQLIDTWTLPANENYHLQVYGPNGFFREFLGNGNDPALDIALEYQRAAGATKKLSGNAEIKLRNTGKQKLTVEVTDNAYKGKAQTKIINPGAQASIIADLSKSSGWYDLSVKVKGQKDFEKRYAGRVETGRISITDPFMGRVV